MRPRDDKGRITRSPTDPPHPFAEYLDLDVPRPERDGRSERKRYSEPMVTCRVPQIVLDKLKMIAERRKITLSHLVLEALLPVCEPVLQSPEGLHERAGPLGPHFGPNRKLAQSPPPSSPDVHSDYPEYAHVERWREKQERKVNPGFLVEKPRR